MSEGIKLTSYQQDLLRELDEQKLFELFLGDAERRIFRTWKNGNDQDRLAAGPTMDALQILSAAIQSAINEAILSGRHNDIGDTEQE